MTAMTLTKLSKIDPIYDFFLLHTCIKTLFFINDSLKTPLTAHFVLAKERKFKVTPSWEGVIILANIHNNA